LARRHQLALEDVTYSLETPMTRAIAVFASLALSAFAQAADLLVPGQFPTIQAAANAASDGDRVLISPGTYAERVVLPQNRSLELIGTDGATSTIIDARGAGGSGPAVLAQSGVSGVFVASGLTVRGDEGYLSLDSAMFLWTYAPGITILSGDAVIRDCVIEDCTMVDPYNPDWTAGAGLSMVRGSGELEVVRTTFRNNVAAEGGALFTSGLIRIIDSTFENNHGTSRGGAVWNYSQFAINSIDGCVFTGNTSAGSGGAIDGVFDRITNSSFIGNTAAGLSIFPKTGGAIRGPIREIINCIFSSNSAAESGGAYFSQTNDTTITSSLFLDNDAPVASVFAGSDAGALIANCIITLGGSSAPVPPSFGGSIQYSNVEGGFVGEGNIDADPMIADPGSGDFSLLPGSPCIDAGSNLLVAFDSDDVNMNGLDLDFYPFDILGNPRFTQDLSAADTGLTDGRNFVIDMGPIERVVAVATDGNADCNGNLTNDLIDIVQGTADDCNNNLIPDSCDIAADPSLDINSDGIIDACQNLCPADIAAPFGQLNFFDVVQFINWFNAGCP
tara:strand:- start:8224 stop:9903 length:1680 start_codon:yes stop_codon:yes gene_type:complete